MKFIDLHSHMDLLEVEQAVENMKPDTMAVTCGIHPETNRQAARLARRFPSVKCTLGLYPIDALETELGRKLDFDLDAELQWLEANDDMIGVGEIGLDYKNGKDIEAQKALFARLLGLAAGKKLPVIIHSRKAEADALDILEQFDVNVVLHCFSGKKNLVHRAIDNGYSFTIPTSVVRSQQYQYLAEHVPLNRIFCETDAPYMSPFRDKPNEPAFVVEAYRKVAEIRGLDLLELRNLVYNNYQNMFM